MSSSHSGPKKQEQKTKPERVRMKGLSMSCRLSFQQQPSHWQDQDVQKGLGRKCHLYRTGGRGRGCAHRWSSRAIIWWVTRFPNNRFSKVKIINSDTCPLYKNHTNRLVISPGPVQPVLPKFFPTAVWPYLAKEGINPLLQSPWWDTLLYPFRSYYTLTLTLELNTFATFVSSSMITPNIAFFLSPVVSLWPTIWAAKFHALTSLNKPEFLVNLSFYCL